MAIILTCPHCSAAKMSFRHHAEYLRPGNPLDCVVSATCAACNMPINILFRSPTSIVHNGKRPSQYPGDVMSPNAEFNAVQVFPASRPDETPDATPDHVARAFVQAAASRAAQHYDAACSMYRKSMELALKAFSPDIEAWKIEKRIDRMAAENRITPELQAWAHELRLDGNEAVHGEDEATVEIADQMHELCKFLLIYLYTLPAQVASAQARRVG